MRLLQLILVIALPTSLAADCLQPGTVEFFPLTSTTKGLCLPDTNALGVVGTVLFQEPAWGCGSGAVMEELSNEADNIVTVPANIYSVVSNPAGYTIQFDYTMPVFSFAGGFILEVRFDGGGPIPTAANVEQLQFYDSFGTLVWDVDGQSKRVITGPGALREGVCSTITLVYDGSFYYIFVDGVLEAAEAHVNGPNHAANYMAFPGPFTNPLQCTGCLKSQLKNVLFMSTAVFPDAITPFPTESPTPVGTLTATPTPDGVCRVSILLPPDLTMGVERTAIVTCTPSEMTATPTQEIATETETPEASATPTQPPTFSETQTPTIGETSTPTLSSTVTSSPTPGDCVVTGLAFNQTQNRVTANVASPGRIAILLLDGAGNEQVVSAPAPSQAGTFSGRVDYGRLPSGRPQIRYEEIGIEWRGAGGTTCRNVVPLEKPFRYYGEKRITQYNTPNEGDATCQSADEKASCVQEQNCSSASATTFSRFFVDTVRVEGSASTNSFGYISGDLRSLCADFFLACLGKEAFKKTSAPTGSCGRPVAIGDLAVDFRATGFGGGTFHCGDQLTFLGEDGIKDTDGLIRDTCPGCKSSMIDRYAGLGGCNTIYDYGNRLVVKYE